MTFGGSKVKCRGSSPRACRIWRRPKTSTTSAFVDLVDGNLLLTSSMIFLWRIFSGTTTQCVTAHDQNWPSAS
jgi:hypothetical protein